MALEVRLQDRARLTKDLDLGLRGEVGGSDVLHERLVDVLTIDASGDFFEFMGAAPVSLGEDDRGAATWRVRVIARLGGTMFGSIYLDISPRA